MSQSRKLVSAVTCAVVACIATGAFAQTGEVYSLNVVGFEKVTAPSNGLIMVSTPFSRSPNTLDDVIGSQLKAGKTDISADNILTWDQPSQSYLTYWLNQNDHKWHALDGSLATNANLTTPMGFWIQSRSGTNEIAVVSGDVVSSSVVTNPLLVGLNMVSYPFSTTIDINNSALTNGKAGKTDISADNIVMWNSSNQVYITFWLNQNDRKWHGLDGSVATNVTVGAGKGFWYQNRNSTLFNWVEAKPYTL